MFPARKRPARRSLGAPGQAFTTRISISWIWPTSVVLLSKSDSGFIGGVADLEHLAELDKVQPPRNFFDEFGVFVAEGVFTHAGEGRRPFHRNLPLAREPSRGALERSPIEAP